MKAPSEHRLTTLRLPVELHRQLVAIALSQHRSLHGHILHVLSEHARSTPPQLQLPLKETRK